MGKPKSKRKMAKPTKSVYKMASAVKVFRVYAFHEAQQSALTCFPGENSTPLICFCLSV
jgi:hypothetical protein